MKYHWLVPLVSAVLNLSLGMLVLIRDRRARLNQVFLWMSVTLTLWNLNNFAFYAIRDPARALWWGTILRTGTILTPSAVFHLALTLAATNPVFSRWLLGVSYAISGALVVGNAEGLLVSGARRYPWGLYPIGTKFYGVFIASAIIQCLGTLAVLIHHYQTTNSPRRKLQTRFWLLAATAVIPAALSNFLPMYGVPVYPMGHLGNTIYAAIIAYAIVRHRLMDIELVVTKGIAYVAVATILIGPTFGLLLWLQRVSFGRIQPDFSFAVLLMFISIGVLFPTLRLQAQSRIQRALFRQKSEYRAVLSGFTRSIVRILDREKLIRTLALTLIDTLQLDCIGMWLWDERRRVYAVCYAAGIPATTPEFLETDAFVRSLAHRQEAVLRDELEASPDSVERTLVTEVCRQNGWEVCIPLTVSAKLIGFINLGAKQNLDVFSAEDLDLLDTLAAEAAIALENARLYDELKKSQEIIRRADRLSALGTLAAGIAHEIRNPLVSIQTFFQLAPERLHDEEFFTSFLGMAAGEVKRISDLITELLTFARSPNRVLGPLNLNEVADRVAKLLEPEARKRELSFTRALSPDLPLVQADGDQMKQVLINLILNAIEATEPGGEVSLVSRSVDHDKGSVTQLEVRDTGVGIPDVHLDDVFNPFFTTKDKGTGLGLAIAHQIIAEHGGSITIQSEPGHGTSVFVNLLAYAY
jgi:two-component system, NtrC family, sensor kinase